jgi:hypothetical protein
MDEELPQTGRLQKVLGKLGWAGWKCQIPL